MKFKAVTFIDSSFLNCYFEDVSSVGSSFNNCTFVDSFFYNTGERVLKSVIAPTHRRIPPPRTVRVRAAAFPAGGLKKKKKSYYAKGASHISLTQSLADSSFGP